MCHHNIIKAFPIESVRAQFPALNRRYRNYSAAYLDGPGGSQVVGTAIDAMTSYMSNGGANLHGQFPSSRETEEIIAEAKMAVADLFRVDPREVAFGANATTLAYAISRALCRTWTASDEVVVTEIDHRANVDPWVAAAADKGAQVRWIEVDPVELTLNTKNLETVITDKTKIVAVSLASNAVGTINDVKSIATRAHEVGALVVVDAVHAVPHFAIDRDELGADILLCSAYKFFGPHVGIAVIKSETFEGLNVYKLAPAPTDFPDKLETGTQNHEGIAGIQPAIEFIAGLGHGESRREKIISGFEQIEAYENHLASRIRRALAQMPQVHLYQAPPCIEKTPTIAFRIAGMDPQEVCKIMAEEYGVFVASGDFYASTLGDKLQVNESGGWIRAGLAPYNTEEEVDRLIEGIQKLVNR